MERTSSSTPSPPPVTVVAEQRCVKCKSIITDAKNMVTFAGCTHVLDRTCMEKIQQVAALSNVSDNSSSGTVVTLQKCPNCDGTIYRQACLAKLVQTDSSVIASSTMSAEDLSKNKHTLSQLIAANISWNVLLKMGLKKVLLTRKNGWFDPQALRFSMNVDIGRLVEDVNFKVDDLISRKVKPDECSTLDCNMDYIVSTMKPTAREFFLLQISFDDAIKYMKLNKEVLLKIFRLPGRADPHVFSQLLKNTLGYTLAAIDKAFPKFIETTELSVDVKTVLLAI